MDDPSGRPPAGGVARRRRERRLRAQLRHEQQTVRMVLATVTHHSFQVGTAHDGLRAQKTVTSTREVEERVPHAGLRAQKAPPPGMRPGVLQDPAPQGRVGQHSGIGYELVLALDVPVLQMVEQPVDASALAFLEEIEANDLEDEYMKLVHAGFHKSPALKERMREVMRRREVLRQKGRGRKKKKRRKRRTPRTSSLPSRRPRRRLRRWHAPGWFSSAFLLALCSSLSLAGPRCSTSRLLDQKNSYAFFLYSGICKAGIAGTLHLAMCLFPGLQAHDARHHGRYGPDGHFCARRHRQFHGLVQLLDEVVVPVVCNDICPGPAACTVGDDFRLVSVFCVALDSTADTCGASVYKAFWKNFSLLSLKRWIAVLEVDSRLSVIPVFSAMLGSTVADGEWFFS